MRRTAMPRIALVADDLTGASDAAAPFHAIGLPTRIVLNSPALALPPDSSEQRPDVSQARKTHRPPQASLAAGVTAMDLDTRAGSAAAAASRTAEAVARLSGVNLLVKTVDSAVRGHLEAEIAAALSASGRATAIIAPAFPAEGRTTVGGIQFLRGRPVHETAFARDPSHPVTDADLARLIPGAVAAGNDLGRHVGRTRYVIADAASDRDLDAIVAAVPRVKDVLWVGSRGLAEALARHLSPGTDRPDPPNASRVLVVVDNLQACGEQFVRGPDDDATMAVVNCLAERAVEIAERVLAGGCITVLHGPTERLPDRVVTEALAYAAASLAERQAFDGLVLTGGQTARTVLLALGTGAIRLTGRPEPGITLGVLDRPAPISSRSSRGLRRPGRPGPPRGTPADLNGLPLVISDNHHPIVSSDRADAVGRPTDTGPPVAFDGWSQEKSGELYDDMDAASLLAYQTPKPPSAASLSAALVALGLYATPPTDEELAAKAVHLGGENVLVAFLANALFGATIGAGTLTESRLVDQGGSPSEFVLIRNQVFKAAGTTGQTTAAMLRWQASQIAGVLRAWSSAWSHPEEFLPGIAAAADISWALHWLLKHLAAARDDPYDVNQLKQGVTETRAFLQTALAHLDDLENQLH